MLSLLDVQVGRYAELKTVHDSLQAKLLQYGLHVGDRLRILRVAPLGGPVLVEVNGREIALGRAVAEKMFVEAE